MLNAKKIELLPGYYADTGTIAAAYGTMAIVHRVHVTGDQVTLMRGMSFDQNRKRVIKWSRSVEQFLCAAFSPGGDACIIVRKGRVMTIDISDKEREGFSESYNFGKNRDNGFDIDLEATAAAVLADTTIVLGSKDGNLHFYAWDGYAIKCVGPLPFDARGTITRIMEIDGGLIAETDKGISYVRLYE